MERQNNPSFPSGTYPGMLNSSEPQDSYHCNSNTSLSTVISQGSFKEAQSLQVLSQDYPIAGVSESVDEMYGPWLLEAAAGGSSLSKSSSMSTLESKMSQSCIGQSALSLHHLQELPISHRSSGTVSQFNWIVNTGNAWYQQCTEGHTWANQPFLSAWGSHSHTGLLFPSAEHCFPPIINSTVPLCSQFKEVQYPSGHLSDSASFRQAPNAAIDMSDSSRASDPESDESDDDNESARPITRPKHRGMQSLSSVLKLGKLSMAVQPCNQSEQRHYFCPFSSKVDPNGNTCSQRFVRPEHLRRHVKTVHGTDRDYTCKVPGCNKAFSRGDNLRDHYWTHLNHGGRAGRNDKMSLVELKAILGPKERMLVKRLKMKLKKQKDRLPLRAKL